MIHNDRYTPTRHLDPLCSTISKNMLTGSLPASFSQLRSLVEFKCASNQLEGTIPKLTQLQMAQEYDLSSNKFSGPFPIDMVELSGLVAFTVSKNELTGTLPSKFNKLRNLELFLANSNQLSSTLPESLVSLPKLQTLDLTSNYLTGAVPGAFVANLAVHPSWYEWKEHAVERACYSRAHLAFVSDFCLCRMLQPQLCPARTFRMKESKTNLGLCEPTPVTATTQHSFIL
jgi:hypothetical protein